MKELLKLALTFVTATALVGTVWAKQPKSKMITQA
jgi:hypothetical protein